MAETATKGKKPKPAASVIEPARILELGNGLELWKVHPSSLREQDVNARAMRRPCSRGFRRPSRATKD